VARITDKERLDWLTRNPGGLDWLTRNPGGMKAMLMTKGWLLWTWAAPREFLGATPRAAIDAAIKAEPKPKEAKP